MLPFLSKGASGIKELEKQSDKFGTTIGNKSIKDLAAAKEGQRKWQASMDGLKVTIGAQLLPMVTQFINFIRDHVIPIVQKITGFIRDHQGVMKLLGIIIGTVIAGLKIWAIVQGVLNAVMAANPIALVVIAIAGLAAGIIYAYKHSAAFRRIVADAFGVVRAAGALLWSALKTVFGALVQAWKFVGSIFHSVGGAIGAIFGFIKEHWGLLLAPLTGGMSILIQHWRGVRDAFVGAWHFIRDHVFGPIKTAFRAVRDVVRIVSGEINKIWKGLGDGLKWAWDHTIGYVFGLIKGAIAAVKSALSWLSGGGNVKIVKAGHNGPTKGKGSGVQFGTGTTQDTAGSIYGTPVRASGGPVVKGHPYIVGDAGRPELFIPDGSGYIEPRTDLAHRHKRHARNGGGPAGSESLVVNVYVNGALSTKGEIAQAVKNALETNLNGGGTLTVRSGAIRTRH
jgi:phage-related protein